MFPVSHVNIQIHVQYVTEIEGKMEYGKWVKEPEKKVRDERINVTSEDAAKAFAKAAAALEVLNNV